MKTRCYPKYSYISFGVISIVMFIFSLAPFIIKTNDEMIAKAAWSFIMLLMGVIFMIASIQHMQYCYIDGNYIVLRSAFGTIMKLEALNVHISIETLPTYYSLVISGEEKWICLYDSSLLNVSSFKFQSGCSNNKKLKRIQIIYTDDNKKLIEQWLYKFK